MSPAVVAESLTETRGIPLRFPAHAVEVRLRDPLNQMRRVLGAIRGAHDAVLSRLRERSDKPPTTELGSGAAERCGVSSLL